MGKQTDAHITNVIDTFQDLETSIKNADTTKKTIDTSWSNMMAAYDSKGKAGSSALLGGLQTAVNNYAAAVTLAKTRLVSATTALNNFDTFVTAKDKSTKNPLAKKSIGKAKKFVAAQKSVLSGLKSEVDGMSDLGYVVTTAKQHYA